MNSYDDFDSPNTKPGFCPVCGQPATIWEAVTQNWECVFCNWRGRKPDPMSRQIQETYP